MKLGRKAGRFGSAGPRRRRHAGALMAILMLLMTASVSGCGASTGGGSDSEIAARTEVDGAVGGDAAVSQNTAEYLEGNPDADGLDRPDAAGSGNPEAEASADAADAGGTRSSEVGVDPASGSDNGQSPSAAGTTSAGEAAVAGNGDAGDAAASPEKAASNGTDVGTVDPAEEGIVAKSSNELSTAEKEALLKSLESELDDVFAAIGEAPDEEESALDAEGGQ